MNQPETTAVATRNEIPTDGAKEGRHVWQRDYRKWPAILESRLYSLISDHAAGGDSAPGDWLFHTIRTYPDGGGFFSNTSEDGGTLWIGNAERQLLAMSRREGRSLAWFILWRWWVRAEWFGLRRRVWYWLLFRRVARWKAESGNGVANVTNPTLSENESREADLTAVAEAREALVASLPSWPDGFSILLDAFEAAVRASERPQDTLGWARRWALVDEASAVDIPRFHGQKNAVVPLELWERMVSALSGNGVASDD